MGTEERCFRRVDGRGLGGEDSVGRGIVKVILNGSGVEI